MRSRLFQRCRHEIKVSCCSIPYRTFIEMARTRISGAHQKEIQRESAPFRRQRRAGPPAFPVAVPDSHKKGAGFRGALSMLLKRKDLFKVLEFEHSIQTKRHLVAPGVPIKRRELTSQRSVIANFRAYKQAGNRFWHRRFKGYAPGKF